MLPFWPSILLFLIAFCATIAATRLVLAELLRRGIFDLPNERSSHVRPTPKGGGIALVTVCLVGWLYVGPGPEGAIVHYTLIVLALVLAFLSWVDDLGELSVVVRLAVQMAAIALMLAIGFPAGNLSFWIGLGAMVVIGLGWVWFVNLYNFMDGIDGITGIETLAIGGGVAILAINGMADTGLGLKAVVVAASALGFLVWNWHPARIFLGDVGSVPLGFLCGWMLLSLVQSGAWAAAIILPLYYFADSGLTLVRRGLRGAPVWRAHREHAYQRALLGNSGHDRIASAIALANVGLIALAVLSSNYPLSALVASFCIVGGLLLHFERLAARPVANRSRSSGQGH